jgi:hypothetical protein
MGSNSMIIQSPWLNYFYKFVENTQKELLLVAPFFSLEIINKVLELAGDGVALRFLFGADAKGIASGFSNYEALVRLHNMSSQRDIVIKNIPNLHAKVVISDKNKAIVSSSNLTMDGFQRNIEFGIEVNGYSAMDLYKAIQEYWNDASVIELLPGINLGRERLTSFQIGERNLEVPEIPVDLGKTIKPKGIDPSFSHQPKKTESRIVHPMSQVLVDPDKRHNLLYNVWWNDNRFEGPCLDISTKTVCKNYFLRNYKEDLAQKCETTRDGCDSAYIFSNYAYYINTNLDNRFLNKCAFFISKNPSDDRYWLIGYFLISEIGEDFNYVKESGEDRTLERYIRGDKLRSLRFQPYMPFDERFIKQLSLGTKWGKRDTSEINWITHHTRSSASCTYISNADAATILETYMGIAKNPREREIISEVLRAHFFMSK